MRKAAHVAGEPPTDADLDKLYHETVTAGPENDTRCWENPHRLYARAVLARYASLAGGLESITGNENAALAAMFIRREADRLVPKYPLCFTVDFGDARGKVGRATYRPDWSKSAPWVSYVGGAAGRHFETLEQATAYFRERHKADAVGYAPGLQTCTKK